jgi:4-amino-4-deoxy-L-arabinose transferase-like glycosyltransferase
VSLPNRLKAAQPIIIVMLLTVFLHAWAVSLLPQDFDEPIYVQNAFDYADAIRSGSLQTVIDYPGNPEHPAFVKLLYAGAALALGKAAAWTNVFFASRAVSALFGALAVLFVCLAVDPLAAGLLAVHTLAVKYTSQAYLEAVPHAMTIAAVLAFLRVEKGRPGRWLWLSAAALGVAAASKYSYLPVILVVLGYLAVFEKRLKFQWLLLYGLLALAIFFALDIHLWSSPLDRLYDSLTFHLRYSQGQHVEEVGYPWYQPLIWVFTSAPADWHPNVFFYFGFDGLIAILAFAGIGREWRERRWLAVWLVAGIVFLLLWPTKWPQYALTVTPALCIMAAESWRRFVGWVRAQESYWGYLEGMFPRPGRWLWIAVGAFALFIAAIYLSAAIKLAVGRVGWSNLNEANSPLPGNTVHALLPLDDGRMLIGTEQGAALWTPPETTDQPASWTLFHAGNSGLAADRVLALARTEDGALWFGTADGVSRFDGQTWRSYIAADLGLPDDTILSLASGENGGLYAGTLNGAAFFDGDAWHPLEYAAGHPTFALLNSGGELWLALDRGAWKIHLQSGEAVFYLTDAPIRQFLLASDGTLWAATSGAGLARLEGSDWFYYRPNNSGLPYSTINWVAEIEPGELWIGASLPTSAGGAAVRFRNGSWQVFLTNNSGASGAEVTVIAVQSGQVWMGTRTAGIDLFQLGRTK